MIHFNRLYPLLQPKRMKHLLTLLLGFTVTAGFSQCIDEQKVKYGGDFGHYEYIYFCPSYDFAYGGDTSKKWSILNPIDIRQVASTVVPVKEAVEQQIRAYAGDAFFSNLTFSSIQVVYLDSLAQFKGRGPAVDMTRCKGKYFLTYYFRGDSKAAYCIGVAVDEQGNILSPFSFPSKQDYKPIDTTLTVCEVLSKARKFNRKLGEIQEVRFDYNPTSKRFYWLVAQEVKKPKREENTFIEVVIDAAEPARINAQEGKEYHSH